MDANAIVPVYRTAAEASSGSQGPRSRRRRGSGSSRHRSSRSRHPERAHFAGGPRHCPAPVPKDGPERRRHDQPDGACVCRARHEVGGGSVAARAAGAADGRAPGGRHEGRDRAAVCDDARRELGGAQRRGPQRARPGRPGGRDVRRVDRLHAGPPVPVEPEGCARAEGEHGGFSGSRGLCCRCGCVSGGGGGVLGSSHGGACLASSAPSPGAGAGRGRRAAAGEEPCPVLWVRGEGIDHEASCQQRLACDGALWIKLQRESEQRRRR